MSAQASVILELGRTARAAVLQRIRSPETWKRTRILGVIGNEGGDMDSVVSALYASLAVQRGMLHVPAFESAPVEERVVVPFINFPIADLPLRGDVAYAFREQGLDPTEVFLSAVDAHPDAVDANDLLAACDHLLLVDHNVLKQGQHERFGDRVVGIIDHHADSGAHRDADPRIITKCGSATTLLAHCIGLDASATLPLARFLLLAPIVLDTMNFDPAMGKVTPADVEAAAHLLALASDGNDKTDPAGLTGACRSFHEALSDKKFDVSHLTIAQNLRRDYKAFTFPVPSDEADGVKEVRIGIPAWLENGVAVGSRHTQDDLEAEFSKFAAQEHVDALMIMFAFGKESDFRRQLMYWTPKTPHPRVDAARELLGAFVNAEASRLSGPNFVDDDDLSRALCAPTPVSEHERTAAVAQNNVELSRKGLVPLLSAFAEKRWK
jgi:exopolyphosphatase